MKKYIFLIFLFLLTYEAYPQVRLSSMDSITTFAVYDYSYWNTLTGGAYLNRKVSWSALRTGMIDYIDGLANTWALKQTFTSGATFSAGANGTVTFSDSVVNTGTSNLNRIYPTTSSTSQIGTVLTPYQTIWGRYFRMPNTEGNDSCLISYDDSTVTFDKEVSIPTLRITAALTVDSSVTSPTLKVSPNEYQIVNVTDSIITTDILMSNIVLQLPGDVTSPGIEKITMTGAPEGHIIVLFITTTSDSVVFQDSNADGNLRMAGDFNMNTHDNIAFMYIKDADAGENYWIEIWRKDN